MGCLLAILLASDFYAAPDGAPSNDGSLARPWDLQTALNHPPAVRPGDTIWLRGGVYRGAFRSNLAGAAGAPIVVRNRAGERAILDGHHAAARSSGVVLNVYGSHTWFWGFEVTSSDPNPTANAGGPDVPEGVTIRDSHHIKLVNLVVHDLPGQGIAFWSENTDSEIEGCLVYYNGLNGFDHGIYLQNRTGIKRLADNVVHTQASHGIHAYGSTEAYLDNLRLDGNVIFNNGYLIGQSSRNLLLGGLRTAQNPVVTSTYTWFSGTMGNSNIGYSAGASTATIRGNWFVAGNASLRLNMASGTFADNLLVGPTDPSDLAAKQPSNTYLADRPASGLSVFVRPNPREAGRAHVTVYNWGRLSQASADLSGIGLAPGTSFEIRDAQNYFGPPVLTGTYGGGAVSLPLGSLSTAVPARTSFARPAHTAPDFAVFVVVPGAAAAPAPPTSPASGGEGSDRHCGALGVEAVILAILLRRRRRG